MTILKIHKYYKFIYYFLCISNIYSLLNTTKKNLENIYASAVGVSAKSASNSSLEIFSFSSSSAAQL